MEAKKIVDMSDEEISLQLEQLTHELFLGRFERVMGREEAPSKIRAARKQIARLKTAQRAREITTRAASA